MNDYANWDAADLAMEDAYERRHHNALLAHPDCRDPDHPGCECCNESEDDQ